MSEGYNTTGPWAVVANLCMGPSITRYDTEAEARAALAKLRSQNFKTITGELFRMVE